jgi:hypothetical protein
MSLIGVKWTFRIARCPSPEMTTRTSRHRTGPAQHDASIPDISLRLPNGTAGVSLRHMAADDR